MPGGVHSNSSGFSLVEVLVSVAISTALVVGFSDLFMTGMRSYRGMHERSSLSLDSLLLIEYFRHELLIAGGGQVRAWQGIWVEDNCNVRAPFPACTGSDRITVSSTRTPLQQCGIGTRITAVGVTPAVYQMPWSSPGVCCVTPDFVNQHIMLTLDDFYSSRYVTAVDQGTCRMTIKGGQAAAGDIAGGTTDWNSGIATLMTVKTFYWDSQFNSLIRFQDANGDGLVDAGERSTIAVGVYDLQIAMGYDSNPADGVIAAAADGLNDEWLFNNPTAVETFGTGAFVAPATRSQLLLVNVGIVLGVNNPNGTASNGVQILNGILRSSPGIYMQPRTTQVAPRNSYVFQ